MWRIYCLTSASLLKKFHCWIRGISLRRWSRRQLRSRYPYSSLPHQVLGVLHWTPSSALLRCDWNAVSCCRNIGLPLPTASVSFRLSQFSRCTDTFETEYSVKVIFEGNFRVVKNQLLLYHTVTSTWKQREAFFAQQLQHKTKKMVDMHFFQNYLHSFASIPLLPLKTFFMIRKKQEKTLARKRWRICALTISDVAEILVFLRQTTFEILCWQIQYSKF